MMEEEQQTKKTKGEYGDEGNDSKSSGASLALGSSEYGEYVRDKAGIDEHEQERVKLAQAGHLSQEADVQVVAAKSKDDTATTSVDIHERARKARERVQRASQSTPERISMHRRYKASRLTSIQDAIMSRVLATPGTEDDKAAKKYIKKDLARDVWDEGVTTSKFDKEKDWSPSL